MALRLIIFLALFPLIGYAQKDSAFTYTFGGIQNDVCNQVKPTWDGGYILIGTTNSFGTGYTSFYAVKTDSLCKHQWSNTYGGSQIQDGFSVTPTLDKGFAFLGFTDSYGAGGYDVYLVKTDSLGKLLWEKTYGGPDWDFGYSIAQTLDSGYIICGLTYSYGAGNGDVYVVRTDKKGDTIWTRTIGGTGYDIGNSVYVQEDSLFVIAGLTTSFGNGDTDSYFIELNSKGMVKTSRTYGITKNDAVYSIRGTMDKGFVMFGYTDSIPGNAGTQQSEMMLKTDSVGKMQWLQIYYNSSSTAIGKDALECPDGNLLSVGTAFGTVSGPQQMNIQYEYPGGGWREGLFFEGTGYEQGISIAYRNKYNLVFGGTTTYGAGLLDAYLVRFAYDSIQATYKLSQSYYTDSLSPESIKEPNVQQVGVRIFPNPMVSSASVLVQGMNGQKYWLNLFDELGKNVVRNMSIEPIGHGLSETLIDRNDLSSGTYIYDITDLKYNRVATGKIIIQ
jgi:hypothetical protein